MLLSIARREINQASSLGRNIIPKGFREADEMSA